jgi:MoxR-like ATPase
MSTTRTDYEHALTALGICISARIPVLLWGNPGEGKTAVVESARDAGWHVETLIVSHYEPSDFAGLPIIGPHATVTLAPPAWAQRLADHDGPSIAFFDEFSTASPALQAAALRPLTHYEVGALQLPATVSFVAAANPTDVAAAGWELAAPTASRFVHLDWSLPLEVYSECLVTGEWPAIPVHPLPEGYAAAHEFLYWSENQDLPSPEEVLAQGADARFKGYRPDQVYVILQGVLAAVVHETTPERWTSALEVCAAAAKSSGVDPAIPVVRALLRGSLRPVGVGVPSSITVFAPSLALAGLLPS